VKEPGTHFSNSEHAYSEITDLILAPLQLESLAPDNSCIRSLTSIRPVLLLIKTNNATCMASRVINPN